MITKLDVLKELDRLMYEYLENKGPAILHPEYGVPLKTLEKKVDEFIRKTSNCFEKDYLRKAEVIRHLKEESFIEITNNEAVFILSKGRNYIDNPNWFDIRNHWSFPYLVGFLFSLIGMVVGTQIG